MVALRFPGPGCVGEEPAFSSLTTGQQLSALVRELGPAAELQKITFKNYYTAFLTVRLQRRVTVESDRKLLKWKTCLRNMCLMPNPHTENGAQDYFSIYRHQMLFEPDDVMTVRLILRQPSPVWLNFTVEDIKMYECDHDKDKVQGPWLSQLTPERPLNLSDLASFVVNPCSTINAETVLKLGLHFIPTHSYQSSVQPVEIYLAVPVHAQPPGRFPHSVSLEGQHVTYPYGPEGPRFDSWSAAS
uniref:uncharacterized protein n=1 Tax=Pristiophorus japonicus TaxID=55135 RepID=UPI00398E56CF